MTKTYAAAAASAVLIAASGGAALAGGFGIKEGSATAQGASFAGATAGDADVSYSFFNPAALRGVEGIQIAVSNSYLIPSADLTTATGSWDGGQDAFVGAAYIAARLGERTVLGLRVNAPFGLATEYPDDWAGRYDGTLTDLKTFEFSPMVSYDVSDDLTIGVGATMIYGDLTFASIGNLGFGDFDVELTGDGVAFGFSAGLLWDVMPSTTIGLAFKSGYDFQGDGEFLFAGTTYQGAQAYAELPPTISLGARIDLTDSFTLLGEAQWQGWASLDELTIVVPGFPSDPSSEFAYEDAFYFALGGEYAASEALTLRTGVAWDGTPTTDEHRSPRIPDGDRLWLSAGGSYQMTENLKLDLAYSYLFTLDENPITLTTGDATSEGSVHILSLGASYDF